MSPRYKTVELRFYGDLADFVPDGYPLVERTFDVAPSVKDTIEAAGVPHPEVDLVLVDGEPVGWDYTLRDGDRIAVYPRFRSLDVSAVSRVHVAPLTDAQFVLDAHLGKLARHLRLLGFDATLPADATDAELAQLSARDHRALLTRDLGILKRTVVSHGYFVRSVDPIVQCAEVLRYFDLADAIAPYSRCLECNASIAELPATEIPAGVPPAVARRHDRFRRCIGCGRTYWVGTHVDRLDEVIASVRLLAREPR